MVKKSAPLYAWQIEVQEIEQKSKSDFLKDYADEIGFSKRYIYDNEKYYLKDKYDLKDNVLEEIIEESNRLFILKQKELILKDFTDFLEVHDEFIKISDRESIKSKYYTDYHNFYNSLNFDDLINKHNENLIKERKEKILENIKNELESKNMFIDESIKEKYKSEYNVLSFYFEIDRLIDDLNLNFINKQKIIVSEEFNEILRSTTEYISDADKDNFKSKFNTEYFDFYSELDMDELIDEFNGYFIEKKKEDILKEFNEMLESRKNLIQKEDIKNFKLKYNTNYFDFFTELELDKLIDEFNRNLTKKERFKSLEKIKDNLGLSQGYIPFSQRKNLKSEIDDGKIDFDELIDYYNEKYIEKEAKQNKEFFEDITGIHLDNDQIKAVLTDDDNTQIVAGAGTGKTLTIQAKVKYLIEKQGVSPADILCISFSNSAKDDLNCKLVKTLGDSLVDVRTFHSIGYSVLRYDGTHREVPDYEIKMLINKFFKESIIKDEDFIKKVIDFFAFYYNIPYVDDLHFNFETIRSKLNKLDEYEEFLKEYLKVDSIGEESEYMKNFQELVLANYLFIHNINYNHSNILKLKSKKHDIFLDNYFSYLFGENFKNIPFHIKKEFINNLDEDFDCKELNYFPNFFLPEYDLYIQLSKIKPNWKEYLSDENKQKWVKQLKIRDKINKDYKTKLLTIYDYGEDIDKFLEVIGENLENNNVKLNNIDYTSLFNLLIVEDNLPEYKTFIKTIDTFINLFKGNSENIDFNGNDVSELKFKQYAIENSKKFSGAFEKRNKFFLEIIEIIYKIYSQKLADNHPKLMDFNDMINDAIVALRKGAYIHKYKYIIVDEYQDTSHTRYNLLKEIQNRTGAKVVVVGDDWQSIYGFTGCDVGLFSEFDKYFENPKMVKIRTTRRNSQALIDVAGDFVQENKMQIPKKLNSDDKLTEKPIKLVGCMSKADNVLSLMYILNEISQIKSNANILILGRNNRDIYNISCKEIFTGYEDENFTTIIYENKPDLNIQFRTVHKSKGLEADYVIVLNLTDKLNGFPNKMDNDSILDFVKHETNENINFPEERRLFYVALTRTKNDVFLFHNEKRPSIFINEIKDNNAVQSLNFKFSNDDIIRVNSLLDKPYEVIGTDNICPKCKSGYVNLILNNEKGTSYFRCSNFCGWNGGSYHNSDFSDKKRAIKLSDLKYAKVCECGGMKIVKSRKLDPEIKFLGCNFYETRGCPAESLPFSYYNIDEEVYHLNLTKNDVYYLQDYVPKDKRRQFNSKYNKISKIILDYKDGEEYAFSLFTRKLMKNLSLIINREINEDIDKIVLVAVPSSKTNKIDSTIKKTIDAYEEWYKFRIIESQYGIDKEIVNCKNLLERIEDVPTAHLGEGRANCEEHIKSIKCNKNNLSNENTVYIILDDITTTGNSMRACKQILLNNGACEENIYLLAIGATVRSKHEEV